MYCKSQTHDHSKSPVVVAKENRTEPWGRRPFHCPDCFQANRKDKNPLNWRHYPNVASAQFENRPACEDCFK